MSFRLNPFWWVNPIAVVWLVTMPFLLMGLFISEDDYVELWNTQKYINLPCLLTVGGALACFSIGYALHAFPTFRRIQNSSSNDLLVSTKMVYQLFLIAISLSFVGYVVWWASLLARGGAPVILNLIRGDGGASYIIRQSESNIPGITTCTQFGIPAMVLGAYLLRRREGSKVKLLLSLLVGLALARSLVWSERLAALELIIPFAISLGCQPGQGLGAFKRRLFSVFPLLAAGGLYVYFTIFEYFRSWNHYQGEGMNIWTFGAYRLGGYYVTALNNGALVYEEAGRFTLPYYSLHWLWKLPILANFVTYESAGGSGAEIYVDLLNEMANPEFNNPSGIFPYFSDFGVGAYLFWIVYGFISAWAYASFKRGKIGGTLFYPVLYVALMEFSRIPYITSNRVFPCWMFLAGAFWLLRSSASGMRIRANRISNAHFQAGRSNK